MRTVRDVRVRLGIDSKGFNKGMNKANKSVGGLTDSAKALGAIFITGAVAKGFTQILRKASDVQETMNVLEVVFGNNADAIADWSKTVAREMGRSQFRVREMVGAFGALLSPTIQNTEATLEMSQALTKVGIDLASLFNTADDDALAALKSGIVGMVKPLRRYGIDLTVANLQQFALAQGINKSVKEMTSGEKQILRFNFIMQNASQAAGDAARTTQFYANTTKALKDFITETTTIMALEAIPTLEKLFAGFRKATDGLQKLNDQFGIFKPIVIGITAALGAFATKILIRFSPVLLKIAAIGSAFLALGFIIEDIITLFNGGQSAIGAFIDKFAGLGTSQKIVKALKRDWEAFMDSLPDRIDFVIGKIKDLIETIKNIPVVGKIVSAIGGAFSGPSEAGPVESFPGEFNNALQVGESFPGEFSRNQNNTNNANINVTVNAETSASPEDIANVVEERLERHVTKAFDGTVVFAE